MESDVIIVTVLVTRKSQNVIKQLLTIVLLNVNIKIDFLDFELFVCLGDV